MSIKILARTVNSVTYEQYIISVGNNYLVALVPPNLCVITFKINIPKLETPPVMLLHYNYIGLIEYKIGNVVMI